MTDAVVEDTEPLVFVDGGMRSEINHSPLRMSQTENVHGWALSARQKTCMVGRFPA